MCFDCVLFDLVKTLVLNQNVEDKLIIQSLTKQHGLPPPLINEFTGLLMNLFINLHDTYIYIYWNWGVNTNNVEI